MDFHPGAGGQDGAAFEAGVGVIQEGAVIHPEVGEVREVGVLGVDCGTALAAAVVLAVFDEGAVGDRAWQRGVERDRAASLGDRTGHRIAEKQAVFHDQLAVKNVDRSAELACGIAGEVAVAGDQRAAALDGDGTAVGAGVAILERELLEGEAGGIDHAEQSGGRLAAEGKLADAGADDVEVFRDRERAIKGDGDGEGVRREIEDDHIAIAGKADRFAQGAGTAVRGAGDDVGDVALADEDGERGDGRVDVVGSGEGEGGDVKSRVQGEDEGFQRGGDVRRGAGHGVGAGGRRGEGTGGKGSLDRIVEGDGEGEVVLVGHFEGGEGQRHVVARGWHGEGLLAG